MHTYVINQKSKTNIVCIRGNNEDLDREREYCRSYVDQKIGDVKKLSPLTGVLCGSMGGILAVADKKKKKINPDSLL